MKTNTTNTETKNETMKTNTTNTKTKNETVKTPAKKTKTKNDSVVLVCTSNALYQNGHLIAHWR